MERTQAYSGLLLSIVVIGFGYLTGIGIILVVGVFAALLSVGLILVIAGRHNNKSESDSGSILHDMFYASLELVSALFRS